MSVLRNCSEVFTQELRHTPERRRERFAWHLNKNFASDTVLTAFCVREAMQDLAKHLLLVTTTYTTDTNSESCADVSNDVLTTNLMVKQ